REVREVDGGVRGGVRAEEWGWGGGGGVGGGGGRGDGGEEGEGGDGADRGGGDGEGAGVCDRGGGADGGGRRRHGDHGVAHGDLDHRSENPHPPEGLRSSAA